MKNSKDRSVIIERLRDYLNHFHLTKENALYIILIFFVVSYFLFYSIKWFIYVMYWIIIFIFLYYLSCMLYKNTNYK